MEPHAAVSSMPRQPSAPQLTLSQSSMERPHWDHMREQLHCLPANTPHCLAYIVDETASITPEEAQSAIQACGKRTNTYFSAPINGF